MATPRFEYRVEPMFVSPDELQNDQYRFQDTLNEVASDGWVLDETLRVDSSTFIFVYARPIEPEESRS